MKRFLSVALVLFLFGTAAGQQYIPMPTSDARYLYSANNYSVNYNQVINFLLVLNGEDTVVNGKTYKKIMIRYTTDSQTHYRPPIADYPDRYYANLHSIPGLVLHAFLTSKICIRLIFRHRPVFTSILMARRRL